MGKMMVDRAIRVGFGDVPPLLDPSPYLKPFKRYEAKEEEAKMVKDGKPLALPAMYAGEEEVFITYEGAVLAAYKKNGDVYRSERGLF